MSTGSRNCGGAPSPRRPQPKVFEDRKHGSPNGTGTESQPEPQRLPADRNRGEAGSPREPGGVETASETAASRICRIDRADAAQVTLIERAIAQAVDETRHAARRAIDGSTASGENLTHRGLPPPSGAGARCSRPRRRTRAARDGSATERADRPGRISGISACAAAPACPTRLPGSWPSASERNPDFLEERDRRFCPRR